MDITTQQQLLALLLNWSLAHGIRIAVIIIAAYVTQRLSGGFIERLVRRLVPPAGAHLEREAEQKRENTLIQVFTGAAFILIWILAALMALSEAGTAVAPLLAAAGIAGLAFGFGGQYLIRDIISGLFILMENQYRVGDVVCFDETCGLVEAISLRMTTLRDLDGAVHHVPHGSINIVSNLSKGFSRVNINVGVSYSADMENVIQVVNAVGEEMTKDPAWADSIITAPKFLRIDDFADSAVMIKILGDTQPIKQWEVAGELRKRLKVAFDREGIDIPFPQRVVHKG